MIGRSSRFNRKNLRIVHRAAHARFHGGVLHLHQLLLLLSELGPQVFDLLLLLHLKLVVPRRGGGGREEVRVPKVNGSVQLVDLVLQADDLVLLLQDRSFDLLGRLGDRVGSAVRWLIAGSRRLWFICIGVRTFRDIFVGDDFFAALAASLLELCFCRVSRATSPKDWP
jgi:hypothetical protein